MLRIEISNRHYNGDFGVGSIFEEKYSFEIDENICYSNSIKSFCNNEDLGGNILSNVNVSIPFILNENSIQKLNTITNSIQSNSNYLYSESHYKKDSFDFNRYNYVDISINDDNTAELKSLAPFNGCIYITSSDLEHEDEDDNEFTDEELQNLIVQDFDNL